LTNLVSDSTTLVVNHRILKDSNEILGEISDMYPYKNDQVQ